MIKAFLNILFLLLAIQLQAQDSLMVCFKEISHCEKYRVYYNGKLVHTVTFKNFYNKNYVSIAKDSFMIEYYPLKLIILRKDCIWPFYRDTYFSSVYVPNKKYMIIYKSKKYKRRYSIEALWRDEPLRYR